MLWGASLGALELRSEGGATRLRATFPYDTQTELAPGRHEVVASRAFAERIEAGEDVHLLSQHDYSHPLASRSAGTLHLTDGDDALRIEATLDDGTSWARDFLAAHRSGLIRGLSPGFRVARDGERIERRGSDVLRTITRAALFEISAVTRPAYPAAQIEARAWNATAPAKGVSAAYRWRA
ncbi:HK97 family phage prohead protease [Acuticoccus sp. I52.16.1]|uniref:HK97 family phage prohead protease n=1 Tax=Acuticoccus sp. I52.16.1 TaxID=2928472 RepID=UPI001FD54BD6|nr:HK97 family phage prohead protease [Acuticoccus sp. I52.16.1]UOM34860.1 HK97 family phage prohead protease [Acuticoccus sp. I52.16.1]